jgi:hypothetical protein
MPEAVVVSASLACTTMRSSSGLMLTLVAVTVNLPFSGSDVSFGAVDHYRLVRAGPVAVAGVNRPSLAL